MKLSKIALTPGEPSGIGPDLVVQIAQQEFPAEIVVIADPELLHARAKLLNLPLHLPVFDPKKNTQISILPIISNQKVQCGKLDKNNVPYVMQTLDRAVQGCQQGEFAAIVTGPVHKGIINDAGIAFTGHTEYLAEKTHTQQVVMLMSAPQLKVALLTTHLPLHAVPKAITKKLLEQTIVIIENSFKQYFKTAKPKILVCGLNPHAGENGYLGHEEIDIIIPVLEKLRKNNYDLIGPVPADTAFIPQNLVDVDVILAMYHDQGLPVLKQLAFDEAVNVTLGLPFIRTSVDHGTALELAGTGKASAKSLIAAINLAIEMAHLSKR